MRDALGDEAVDTSMLCIRHADLGMAKVAETITDIRSAVTDAVVEDPRKNAYDDDNQEHAHRNDCDARRFGCSGTGWCG